jgi:DNA-binding CsgD family transcriptional regulator
MTVFSVEKGKPPPAQLPGYAAPNFLPKLFSSLHILMFACVSLASPFDFLPLTKRSFIAIISVGGGIAKGASFMTAMSVSPGTMSVSQSSVSVGSDEAQLVKLTKREIEVLTHVIQGKSSKEVADTLFVSKRTVDFHLANVYDKLHVNNRVQAFRRATRLGLIPYEAQFAD